VIPKTKPKFAILEPITFPRAKSGAPFKAAFKLTMSSGAEVAKETTVIPITILGMFNFKDKATAAFNNQFPPKINNTRPPIMNKKFMYFIF
jgi:hypothetical protein